MIRLVPIPALLVVAFGALAGCRPSAADFNGTYLDPPMPASDVALASPTRMAPRSR